MTSADLFREIVYPLRTLSLALVLIFTSLLVFIAISLIKVGFVLAIPGIVALVLFTPVYFRYLLVVLEARANDSPPPVLAVEMVEPWTNLMMLTPVLLYLLGFVAAILFFPDVTWPRYLYALCVISLLPATLAILSITRSAVESLNPLALLKTIRACGPLYLLIPSTVGAMGLIIYALAAAGVPKLPVEMGVNYVLVLLFTLTAAVLREKELARDVNIGPPVERAARLDDIALQKARQNVANHAYGMISRGNRDGGFAHIDQWLAAEAEPGAAASWFFYEMLKWESKEAALFYARPCLAALLRDGDDARALKLISRCLYEDSRWKPAEEDRAMVTTLLSRHQREDLRGLLPD